MKILQLLRFALLGLSMIGAASAAPYRPVADDLVVVNLPQDIASQQSPPRDMSTALALARRDIDQGRRTGDPRKFGEAQALLAPWWNDPDPPLDVLVLRASIKQSLHAFAPALADLDRVLSREPYNMQARLTRAFVLVVTGDAASAATDCTAITDPRARLIRDICLARVASVTGQGAHAYKVLRLHLATMPPSQPQTRHFAMSVLAELAAGLGEDEDAKQILAALAGEDPADVMTRASLCDLLLAQGKPAEVLNLLAVDSESDPLLLRRAIAARQVNDPRGAQWTETLAARFEAAALSGNRVHLREQARFNLEIRQDAKLALALALENWQVQKEPADAALVLRAADAAGSPAAAGPVLDFMARTGMTDHRIPMLKKS